MEQKEKIERSELFYKILSIVKKLNLEKTDKDHYDHISATYDIENLFILEKMCK